MARGLVNYENVSAPDSDYPDGNIKDNPGDNTGTPFDKNTYSDIHQVFAKLLRLAGITASGLPENEYNGFQYLEAMRKLFCEVGEYIPFDRSTSPVIDATFNPLVNVLPGSPNSGNISFEESVNLDYDSLVISVTNNSSFSVTLFASGSDTIAGGASTTVGAGNGKRFCLDKANANWVLINSF